MTRILIRVAICIAVVLLAGSEGRALELSLGIDGGISTVVGYSYGDYFNAGYSIGGNLFYPVHTNISLGGNVRYHSWKANSRPYERILSGRKNRSSDPRAIRC